MKQGQDFDQDNSEGKRTGKWTKEEDEVLLAAVQSYGTKAWKLVSKSVQGRNQVQCLHRWTKILQPGLTKGPWSIAEDRKLLEWVQKEGPNKWTACAEYIRGRSGKQCRERWLNTLNPGVKKGNWEPEEDFLIFKLFTEFGSQWSKINLHFERRTENSIKNRFYSTLRRIAAEKRKEGTSNNDSTCEISNGGSKTKLDSLLKYVPDAIKEKTLKLMKKNGGYDIGRDVCMDNIVDFTGKENVVEKYEGIDEQGKMLEMKFDDENNNEQGIIPKESAEDGGEEMFPEGDNIYFLDNEINNFLDNFFENNDKGCNLIFLHGEKESEGTESNVSNLNVNSLHGGNLNSMVQQLSSLEELLQNTKKQILSGSAFSEPQKVVLSK